MDIGCPRSIGGIESAKSLCRALNIEFELHDIDCHPFMHGYGKSCSEAEITIGIWYLPLTDLSGKEVEIPFYITEGEGFLLLGNEILHKSNLLRPEQLLNVPPGVRGISDEELNFSTFFEQTSSSHPDSVRTYLLVVPSKTSSFKSFFSSQLTFLSKQTDEVAFDTKFSNSKIAKRFAMKLHGYSHLPYDDMITLCQRGGVLTPVLRQALKSVRELCTSCASTGRPRQSRKVSFGKILSSFNSHVQVDFLFVTEADKDPVLHIVDVNTAFSVTASSQTRKMEEAARQFELVWINAHGAPEIVSGDPEFFNVAFQNALRYFGTKFEPRPARRHNKLGVVERKNSVIRTLAQHLLKDADHFAKSRGIEVDNVDIISRATYLSNVLYGSRTLSSFEMVRGYTPSIQGLPQSRISDDLIRGKEEQEARRALKLLDKSRKPNSLTASDLSRDDHVYFYKTGPKSGKWEKGYVRDTEPYFALISSKPNHIGKPIKAAYENIRLVPRSSLLQELDQIDYLFPRSYSIVEEDNDDIERDDGAPLASIFPELSENDTNSSSSSSTSPADSVTTAPEENPPEAPEPDPISDTDLPDAQTVADMFESEESLWAKQLHVSSLFSSQKPRRVEQPWCDICSKAIKWCNSWFGTQYRTGPNPRRTAVEDLNTSRHVPDPSKDIGDVQVQAPPQLPFSLPSAEQHVLKEVQKVVGDKPTSESSLEFVPRWLIDKSIEVEKENYRRVGAYEELDIDKLPPRANLISSHHFFLVKHDGEEDKLKLKCRLVPHGNRDREKDNVRKDSSTAQFPIIRLVLSLASILCMSIASIDIKGAYLQGGDFPRDIYMRPPKGWASSSRKVWKLLKPAYELPESGRIWQLVIEQWMFGQGIIQIPGLPQLFIKRKEDGSIAFAIAKVVDDFLLVGHRQDIEDFHAKLAKRFTVGRFSVGCDLIFNRLHISQEKSGTVHINMQEYLDKINPIYLSKDRRKQRGHQCTEEELTSYLSLTGSLNFLGHGVLPQAAFAASSLQQAVGNLTVAHIHEANKMLAEIKKLNPVITYLTPKSLHNPSYLAFSDASQGKTSYGQTGYLSGIYLPAGGVRVYHVIDWLSCKQSRVSFSSIGAEILAAATSTDRGSLMAESLKVVHDSDTHLPFVLSIDSNGLYSTITTLHEGSDYRLRPTVSRMRDSYENGEIATMQWIAGKFNLADALTKKNVVMFAKLNNILTQGALDDSTLSKAKRVKFTDQRKQVTFEQ